MNGEPTIYFEFSGFVKVLTEVSLTEVNDIFKTRFTFEVLFD